MQTVLRETGNEVTHIYYNTCNGVANYLTKRDIDVLLNHKISEDELKNWLGENFIEDMTERILELLNDNYSIKQFRYDVISYNDELLKDKTIRK